MQRRFLPFVRAFVLFFVSMQAAGAAQAASYVVAPFQINGPDGYKYLSNAVPSMLSSRLFRSEGGVQPVPGQDAVAQGQALRDDAAAARLMDAQSADYVIWGSITVMGEQASLDVNARGADGKSWKKGFSGAVNTLMGSVQQAADAVSLEVFGLPAQRAGAPQRVVAPMNPEFMVNESQAGAVYLNPQIRYQGTDTERIRSQRLDIESRGMDVADFTGDGKNEILLFDDSKLYMYRMENNRLEKLGEHRLPSMLRPLTARSLRRGGKTLIVLACYDESSRDALSMIFSFSGSQFTMVSDRLLFYASVAKLPPLYEDAIVGQMSDRGRIVRGPVFEVVSQGGEFVKGPNISNMPGDANVFNFAWLPGNARSGGDYLALINDTENLLTFDVKGQRLAKSDDRFSGSSVGIQHDKTLPGLGSSSDDIVQTYYVPMRMLTADLDRDGRYELILNKPVSTAGQLFTNYRTYPQGEIHALMWDGIGMDLIWKTRRIRGTVADLALGDADNDGVPDLVVNVNTYPGAMGTGRTRALVTLYPLDLAMTSPDSPIAADD